MAEWNPNIDEAPRDGTELLGYREDAGVFIFRWDAAVSFLTESEIYEIGGEPEWEHEQDWFCADFVAGSRLDSDLAPTHWQWLPAAPTQGQGAAATERFARWIEAGPRLAKAAGCHVGIKITELPEPPK